MRQLLGFLFKRGNPQLPLLSAAGGRGAVALQKLLSALVRVMVYRPPATAASSVPTGTAATSCLHCMLGVGLMRRLNLLSYWGQLQTTKRYYNITQCEQRRRASLLGFITETSHLWRNGQGRRGRRALLQVRRR